MKKAGNLVIINQLIKTMEDAFGLLEKAHEKGDVEKFLKIKKTIIQAQKEIRRLVR